MPVGAVAMPGIHAFVVSWAGQHEKAAAIAQAIRGVAAKVSVVYSDPDPGVAPNADCDLIRRPNELYWGDKFRTCLDACASDLLLVIHADCQCDDWPGLVRKCRDTMAGDPAIGVWAPLIYGANLDVRKTRIASIAGSPLMVVAQTDALVFALAPPVADRLRQASYEANLYGWGIDDMAAAYCYTRGLMVVVDASVLVQHPPSSTYSRAEAQAQKEAFLQQLTFAESIQHRLLWTQIQVNTARYLRELQAMQDA